jgi:boron transporter
MGLDVQNDPYKWPEDGSLKQRLTHPFRGMYHDARRRLPYYLSDIKDGFNYRTFAGTVRIYFVNLLPALAFQLDMAHNTGGFFGVNEALLSSAMAAVVFSLFSVQPLTVVGVTGLISLFNYTIYDIIKLHDVSIYPQFMVWVGIWSGIFHWATAIFNLCDYMRTITDFSSQTFALYVGTIYIVKGVEELAINFYDNHYLNGFTSAMIAILFTLTIYFLEKIRNTTFARPLIRQLLSDYAYPIATIFWTGFAHFPGNLAAVDFMYLPTTRAFYPTAERNWVVDFWSLPAKWIFTALPFGLLMTLLFYYDHNVSSLTAQARAFPLTKPAGFHWDFFLLGCTCFGAGILNIPLPNGLVPQAPVHTDSLTTYTEHVNEIRTTKSIADSDTAPPVITEKVTTADAVAEQRVSHFLMALALVGTMTGPLLKVLHLMPRAIFSGVFFIVGWGSVGGNDIVKRILYLLQEPRFRQPYDPLNRVKKRQLCHFLGWQLLGWAATVGISQTLGAVGFPVLIMALIPLRWVVLPRLFTRKELEVLDQLTATGEVVHVSLGGVPEMPEVRRERERMERDGAEDPEGRLEGDGEEGVLTQIEKWRAGRPSVEWHGAEGEESRGEEKPRAENDEVQAVRHRGQQRVVDEEKGNDSDDTRIG